MTFAPASTMKSYPVIPNSAAPDATILGMSFALTNTRTTSLRLVGTTSARVSVSPYAGPIPEASNSFRVGS